MKDKHIEFLARLVVLIFKTIIFLGGIFGFILLMKTYFKSP
jgi:hypothetical protein